MESLIVTVTKASIGKVNHSRKLESPIYTRYLGIIE